MQKNVSAMLILVGVLLLSPVAMFAQSSPSIPGKAAAAPQPITDQDLQMLREDIRSQRKQITAANMTLTADEATKFWPVYDQYIQETIKINDERWSIIKDYAAGYNSLTDQQAENLMKRSVAVDQQLTALRGRYVLLFQKVVSTKKTAQWYQIDRRLDLVISLQLASQIPVVDPSR